RAPAPSRRRPAARVRPAVSAPAPRSAGRRVRPPRADAVHRPVQQREQARSSCCRPRDRAPRAEAVRRTPAPYAARRRAPGRRAARDRDRVPACRALRRRRAGDRERRRPGRGRPETPEALMGALMVQGVSSWAGKSLLTTALVRFFARRGVRVAPFKGQNMSNNARVVAGGEIGVAQYLQALAAGIEPDVRMNPVLVKPEGEQRSQVVVDGRPDLMLSAMPWRGRGPALWPPIERALRSLL